MEMQFLIPSLLKELIERIDVHETEGVEKNRTQRMTIHYWFVGIIGLLAIPKREYLKLDMRRGGAVEYPSA